MDASLSAQNAPHRRAEDAQLKISRPISKFVIGFVAGACAALFPRLTAQLVSNSGGLEYFSTGYLVCSGIFATLIGAIVTILEWNLAKEPRVTFMAALGIPAIITGSFNTIDSSRALEDTVKQNEALVRELTTTNDIKTLRPRSVEPLSSVVTPNGQDDHVLIDLLVSPAHAGDDQAIQQWRPGSSPSLYQNQARFVVVLDERPTREEAIARAAEISKTIPAQAIISDGRFLIVKRGAPSEQGTALLDALKIRDQTAFRAEILELP